MKILNNGEKANLNQTEKRNKMKPFVSVIMPCYNCEKYIKKTIQSVLNQTYSNFEILIVDDLSTDETVNKIREMQRKDKRIRLIQLSQKGGASIARNKAIQEAKGKYIAFLDGDDMWKPQKLEKQIQFMEDNKICFSYTDYEYMDENDQPLNLMRSSPTKMSYLKMLIGDSIGCLTVMYDATKVGKVQIPSIDKRNDYALWCLILKKVKRGYKYNEILSLYRKTNQSLSAGNKINLLKYHYDLHRRINQFSFIIAFFFTCTNIFNYFINKIVREKKIKLCNTMESRSEHHEI